MSKKNKQVRAEQKERQQQIAREERELANASAAQAIKDFLNIPRGVVNKTGGCTWQLHVLCRTGEGKHFGYDEDEFSSFSYFLEGLKRFFLQSDNAKRFNELYGNDEELGDRLHRLIKFFDYLEEDKIALAELDLINVDKFSKLSKDECYGIEYIYRREKRLLEAYNAAFFTPKEGKAAA